MIIDLQKFIDDNRPYWQELEKLLDKLERDLSYRMDMDELKHFHYLYQRASADLAKVQTAAYDRDVQAYLEAIVARAYGEIHATRQTSTRFQPGAWFFQTLPQTFRRHINAFWLALIVTLCGALFGSMAVGFDADAKAVLLPFSHLQGDPSERVAREESGATDSDLDGHQITFSTYLMTHNIRVSIFAFALGMTFGVGTLILLFYNGTILGAVALDYIRAGESAFLAGWLLPHGSIEIPAFLLAGQAGLVLAQALIGRGQSLRLRQRLRSVANDLITLICGVAIFLVWAGLVESFLSQLHAPILPYSIKIAFGMLELGLLVSFLALSGRNPETEEDGR